MRNFITLILLAVLGVVLAGCATTDSTPTNTAQATEQGGSWSDVRAVLTAVNLGDVARLAAKVPGDTTDGNGGVSLGKDTKPVVKDAIASGRPVIILEQLTVTQSITTGAEATRSGTNDQTATDDTQQTPTNSPTTDIELDIPIP